MTAFVLIAALLALLAAVLVAWPLARKPRTADAPAAAPLTAIAAGIVMLGGSAGLYALWSNWNWAPASSGNSTPAEMVANLARRLEKEPNDLKGWLMLGRSYAVLEQYPLAMRAYQRADRLAEGKNAEALIGIAEALTLQSEAELDGRAGRLFEQALALEPDSGKALFFSAIAAQRRGELPLARERLARLLALDPPANIKPVLEQQIAMLDAEIAGKPAGAPSVAGPAATAPPATTVPQATAAAAEARVSITVRVAPQLAAQAGSGAPLFVLVRSVGQRGPPLAAKRLDSRFPQQIVLTPADAMIAGRSFAPGDQVEVVARIALSGDPVAKTGDPFGQVVYDVGTDQQKQILIDRLTP